MCNDVCMDDEFEKGTGPRSFTYRELIRATNNFNKGGKLGDGGFGGVYKGWCHEHDELLLVYEYMPNGSLDSHLYGAKTTLTWPGRYNVV